MMIVFSKKGQRIMLSTVMILLMLLIATFTDLKLNKIHNKLVFPLMVLGFVFQSLVLKTLIPIDAILGWVFPLILIPFFALNMIGAGDIKLFMAVGMWIGFNGIVNVMTYSILTGGVIALGLILIRKNGLKRLKYLLIYLKSCFIAFKPLPYQTFDDGYEDGRFPFAVVILIGYTFYLVLGEII